MRRHSRSYDESRSREPSANAATRLRMPACQHSATNLPMKIILASPRGFCAGVNMAIERLELAIKLFGTPIYVYHEIVHNKYVVERFRAEGAVFVDHLAEVPEGATLLYSAHGVSPEIRRVATERRLKTIDATCPLVTKVHLEAIRYAKEGYTIVLIGHEGHDEVIGTMGEAPEAIVLVESPEDVDRLELADRKAGLSDADHAFGRRRQPDHRAAEAALSAHRRSAQGRHLLRHAKPAGSGARAGPRSRRGAGAGQPEQLEQPAAGRAGRRERRAAHYLIDGPADIDLGWFQPDDTVLVTAGASAPETVVEQCVKLLREAFRRHGRVALDPRGRSLLPAAPRNPPDRGRPKANATGDASSSPEVFNGAMRASHACDAKSATCSRCFGSRHGAVASHSGRSNSGTSGIFNGPLAVQVALQVVVFHRQPVVLHLHDVADRDQAPPAGRLPSRADGGCAARSSGPWCPRPNRRASRPRRRGS